ncbi:hypothetical protein H839_08464 [Parageobacillus genomosp. 1]|uniref:Uncharacterized protein n=1 Tax=Parageobacillus genomosp. 1 TaxID=1295642 RepID=A0ABC9VGL0_9BACL|nr:hypothetical protein [Parageobacillus genomosp. 1]EZP77652.1 hypothetical protein H839_08464 [Parageobacillus genomosp. 1]
MIGIIGTGLVFVGMALAENKGLVDAEKVLFVLTLGMNAGIMASLFYFFRMLSNSFLM